MTIPGHLRTALLLLVAALAIAAATVGTGIGPLAAHDAPSTAPPSAPTTTASTTAPTTTAPTSDAAVPTSPPPTTTDPASTTPRSTPRPQDAAAATTGTLAPDRARTPGAPLRDAISTPHLPEFERASVALINLEHATDAPVRPMARAAHQACARLDRDVPVLDALAATCRDTIIAAKLSRVLGRRCADTSATCARTADRLAGAADRLVDARRDYAKALRRGLAPSDCRRTLLPTHDDLASEQRLADALQGIADAARSQDPAALAAAGEALATAAERSTTDGRTATAVITELRAACWLPRYPDPIN